MKNLFSAIFNDRYFKWFLLGILLFGIALRLTYFFQNPNLIIDEANIARNLAERNFWQLLFPLDYEQFAPPIFLWIEKSVTPVFGFGEKALRLYLLLSGIAALFILYKILSRLLPVKAIWYPFAMFALGVPYIKYCVVVKQYMPDTLITLLLVWLALQLDVIRHRKIIFITVWTLVGSVAIWSSMTSVFVLAGIGAYYLWQLQAQRKWEQAWKVVVPGLIWFVQFLLYYQFVLKEQISSQGLRHYQETYFLFALPANQREWAHNVERVIGVLGNLGGFTALAIVFHFLLLMIGIFRLWKGKKALLCLTALPMVLVMVAAALQQYSLVERLILFMLPLGLILLGFGLEALMGLRSWILKLLIVSIAIVCIKNHAMLIVLKEFYGFHEITQGMSYLKQKQIQGEDIFIHHSSGDTYKYYTELHPDHMQWDELKGANVLKWDSDYAVESQGLQDTTYFLFTGGFPEEERVMRTAQIERNMMQVSYFEKYVCYVYGYVPKKV